MKACLTLALALLVLEAHPRSERARSPSDATVFIRIIGSAHIEVTEAGLRRSFDLDQLDISTGSGFLFSPFGYVLTNHHVVASPEEFILTRGMARATVTLQIARIDVCFRPDTQAARDLPSGCLAASVAASDADLDLAVLYVGGSNHQYVALGDSDAATAGLSVEALGYPFGRDVEVGKVAVTRDLVPDVSVTTGAISAARTDDAGERRYLQITNTLNPGNSGGPLVTQEGFGVGVISMKLARGSGIGFAIPSNRVIDFLERNGLDQFLPARRLRLGEVQDLGAKGIRIRMPDGASDASRFRSHVAAEAPGAGIALRIDRVLSPWPAKRIEDTLVGASTLEPLAMAPRPGRAPARPANPRLTLGSAVGAAADSGQEVRMDYATLDLGAEKLVARYVGPAEAMAINERVLRESLSGLDGRRLIAGAPPPLEQLDWRGAEPGPGQGFVLPAGWVAEPGAPSPCQKLPQPDRSVSASPVQNYTLVLRSAAWSDGDMLPASAAAACWPDRGSLGEASYTFREAWMGVTYTVEGVLVRTGPKQVLQIEVVSTGEYSAYAREVLAACLKRAAP